jgi:hypothetical protein
VRAIDEIAHELYALPPANFTPARDAAVERARADGDRAAARELAALKRPTQGAHLVNLLALHRPDVVADLIALGEQIREAQGSVSAADLRELSNRRRTGLRSALALCRALADQTGSGEPTAAQVSEAEATLAAAMADPGAAEVVRSGRVVKALSYAGFGAGFGATAPVSTAARGQLKARPQPASVAPSQQPEPDAGRPQPGAAPAGPAPDEDAAARAAERERGQRQRAAWEHLARAESQLAVVATQEQAANAEMDRIADEITRLRSALDATSQRARAARTARQAAEREVSRARREVDAG